MRFPDFPIFRHISPLDKPDYLTWFQQNEPYSDFSFNNLLIWLDINDDLEISQHNDNLVLRFSNTFEDNRFVYTMLGNKNCLSTAEAIFDLQRKDGQEPHLTMVPECALNSMLTQNALPDNLLIKVDVANRDYVFDVEKSLNMEGSEYADFRREIRVVEARNPDLTIEMLDLSKENNRQLILRTLHAWGEDDYFTRNDPMRIEYKAIERYFNFLEHISAECIAVKDNGKLIGFSIFHFPPQKDWVIVNHIKCDHRYKFLFNYIHYASLKYYKKRNISYVNFEQDLGIPGMAYHKKMLRPSRFLFRYELIRDY